MAVAVVVEEDESVARVATVVFTRKSPSNLL
jgi:hypothetical protein